ncbi:MAG: GUN4 domain-containing protein [Mojavia pulchra JT2-VF2]|uniref:GUN4 domain-containing protein n=1 Tax=Mojavia pulchra JT2-VF2 TaxID=287848 RepID=A0A951UEI9_9NOST|nr:GUN4 domain-containing protein [Mojavia pulchra JT2-VF2]
MKHDTRYIETLIKYQEASNNHLEELLPQLQGEFSKQLLELLREWQANQIQQKLKNMRAMFENKKLATIFNKEESYSILAEAQKKYRLLVLFAPPNISPNCPSSLQHDLQIELPEKLKSFLNKDYPFNRGLCPVEFYGNYFVRSIEDTDVRQLQKILAPVPTVVLHSKITDYEVYFNVSFWHPQNNNIAKISMPAWNWEEVKESLQAADNDEIRAIRTIRQIIVTIHQILAAFIADWYYLHLNHTYEPKLFHLESEFALGRWSSDLLQPYIDTLKEIYLHQKEAYKQGSKNLTQEKDEKKGDLRDGLETSKIKPEQWKVNVKETHNLETKSDIYYSKLRYLLSEGKWKEADEETTKIILKIAGQKTKNLPSEQARINDLFLSSESISGFSCEDIRIIDKLWLKYSNAHFGLSIQTCIWQAVSHKNEDINRMCRDFAERVGWLVNGNWSHHDQITYVLDAPIGHLPFAFTQCFLKTNENNWGYWYDFYYRLQNCEL